MSQENLGFANYQAMELQLPHRMSAGFYLQATYDWAKTYLMRRRPRRIRDRSRQFLGWLFGQRSIDLREDRGNDAGPRRQRFLLTGLYQTSIRPRQDSFLANSNAVCKRSSGWMAAQYDSF